MGRVHGLNEKASATSSTLVLTSQRRLLVAWLLVGMLPFTLQVRSFTKFTRPHKMPSNLVVPSDLDENTKDLNRYCPVEGFHMAQVWWNIDTTHYFNTTLGIVCHFVVPQYNTHGAYTMGCTKVAPFYTAPSKCADNSFEIAHYFYHGSIGYYSFYEDALGTYCIPEKTGYSLVKTLGTFDLNGSSLAKDAGSEEYRRSYWYSTVGIFWIAYRALVLRRSFFTCKHYGHKCDQMGELLRRKQTMVFAYESMRLSAHGATNYQRLVLLYLLAEGLMTDLFLLAANDTIFVWIQFISLGYNLSGVLLLLFEMVESMGWLSEISRLFIKRLVFSYESSLLGEFFSAICQPFFLSSINRSKLRDSGPTAVAASYYMWSLVGHGTIILVIIAFIMSVRVLRAVTYVRWKHGRVWAVLLAPCCVDTTLGIRNRMTMLAGYCWEDGELYYKPDALKAFGVLKTKEEDGSEFLVLRKLRWLVTPTQGLYVLGTVTDKRVKPCTERPCTGVVNFFDCCLGGDPNGTHEQSLVPILVLTAFQCCQNGILRQVMGLARVMSDPLGPQAVAEQYSSIMTAKRKLMVAWVFIGLVPFLLQIRSYLKFATPHKITENLLVPVEAEARTDDLMEKCPMQGFHIGQVWWNVATTHYYTLKLGYNLCHYVVPQYNSHGNYVVGQTRVEPYKAAPKSCSNDSFSIDLYLYHGSIGYYSFYDELVGTYCTRDSTAYTHVAGLGTFDINGESLSKDTGNDRYRWSLYYSFVGSIWLVFRGLVLRRSYISCKRYGQKCEQMGIYLRRKAATIFVHESLRLSAHGATNCHRLVLLYMLLEGLMSDLFLLAATDGPFAWIQYVSLGYNLSGILLLLFEIVESMGWLRETCRLCIKRLVFSYESSLLGELLGALGQSYVLTSLNHSDLKYSGPVALEVSYYVWGLVGHGVIVAVLVGFIMLVRILRAVTYVHWKHRRTWEFFTKPCCVDTTLGIRSKMTKLAGYQWEAGKLLYTGDAMKSFGLLKMEEDGTEFLVLRKLHWFKVRQDDLIVIGSVSDQRVIPCIERPCSGVVSFFDRDLGGPVGESESPRSQSIRVVNKVAPSPTALNILPPLTQD